MSYRHWLAVLFALATLLILLFFLARPAGTAPVSPTTACAFPCANDGQP